MDNVLKHPSHNVCNYAFSQFCIYMNISMQKVNWSAHRKDTKASA